MRGGEGVAEDISAPVAKVADAARDEAEKDETGFSRAEKGCEIPDEAGKRRLEKGAKPTVFFVAGIFALYRQDLFALLYLSARSTLIPRFAPAAYDFLAQRSSSSSQLPSPLRRATIYTTTPIQPPPPSWGSASSSNDLLLRPRPTEGSLSAWDIYQHPRWRQNLASFSQGEWRQGRIIHTAVMRSFSTSKHSLSLFLVAPLAFLSRFLPTSSSSSPSSTFFSFSSSLNSLWALCCTPRSFCHRKSDCASIFQHRLLSREIEDFRSHSAM